MKRLLLAEDDPKLSRLLAASLRQDGYDVHGARSSEELEHAMLGKIRYDLVILDRLLGQADTRHKIKAIKAAWPGASIIVVSAINTPMERAELINEGADDYVGKPFFTDELLARLRSLTRRLPERNESQRIIGSSVFDLKNRRLSVLGKFEELSQKEFLLLNALSESGKVMSRPELLAMVWGNINHAETNLIEATVTNLRRKISRIDCGFEIKNQRNLGYWIEG